MEANQQVKTTAVKGTDTARQVRALVKNIYKSAHEAKAKGQESGLYDGRVPV